MTVEELIKVLKKCTNKKTARVLIEVPDQNDEYGVSTVEYDITRVGQYGVIPDVTLTGRREDMNLCCLVNPTHRCKCGAQHCSDHCRDTNEFDCSVYGEVKGHNWNSV